VLRSFGFEIEEDVFLSFKRDTRINLYNGKGALLLFRVPLTVFVVPPTPEGQPQNQYKWITDQIEKEIAAVKQKKRELATSYCMNMLTFVTRQR
jgi:hypothetical protein